MIASPAEPTVARAELGWVERVTILGTGLLCLGVLVVASGLRPNPAGVGSHRVMNLEPCTFLRTTGLPCPSCGMTTSFAWFVRGNLAASLYVQPMGTLLAAAAGMTFWAGLYVAATGKPVYRRLFEEVPPAYYVIVPLGLAIAAWAWKIFIHVRGVGGW